MLILIDNQQAIVSDKLKYELFSANYSEVLGISCYGGHFMPAIVVYNSISNNNFINKTRSNMDFGCTHG